MRSIKYISVLVLFFLGTISAQSTQWVTDKSHSKISFEVSHLVISSVTGFFKDYNISFKSDKPDFSDAAISFTAKVNSIDTDNEKRDDHLRSSDFFDAKKFPEIKFVGKSFTKVDDKKYKLVGDFTIKDVTKEISLDVTFNGTIKDPWGGTRAGFKLEGKINRTDYGLKWNKALEAGGVLVGEDVELISVIELKKG